MVVYLVGFAGGAGGVAAGVVVGCGFWLGRAGGRLSAPLVVGTPVG